MCYVNIILCWAVRPAHRVRAVRDELAVGVEKWVRSQAGGQDVGSRLGNLELLGPEVEVLVHQYLDRLVDGEPVGRPLVAITGGQLERPIEERACAGNRLDRCDGVIGLGPLVGAARHRDRRRNPGAEPSDSTEQHVVAARLIAESRPARTGNIPRSEFNEPGIVVIPFAE